MEEHHVKAWMAINPNFYFAGHWFSRDRYGLIRHPVTGGPIPFERAVEPRVPIDLDQVDDSITADPMDWDSEELQAAYIRARDFLEQSFQTGIYGMGVRYLRSYGMEP